MLMKLIYKLEYYQDKIIINTMNNINQSNNNVVQIINCRANDIVNLLRTKEDRHNFCIEMSNYKI